MLPRPETGNDEARTADLPVNDKQAGDVAELITEPPHRSEQER